MVTFSFSSQFHILRHFCQIDTDYRAIMKSETNYTDKEIDFQLSISGSKFHPVFASNPINLWEKIQKHHDFNILEDKIWKNGQAKIILTYKIEQYPIGIGYDSLLRIDELTAEQKKQLKQEDRDGFLVNYISLNELKPTWQANVILTKGTKIQLITIFPGIFAPALPKQKKQSEKEWIKSRNFWEQYAFEKL